MPNHTHLTYSSLELATVEASKKTWEAYSTYYQRTICNEVGRSKSANQSARSADLPTTLIAHRPAPWLHSLLSVGRRTAWEVTSNPLRRRVLTGIHLRSPAIPSLHITGNPVFLLLIHGVVCSNRLRVPCEVSVGVSHGVTIHCVE